MGSELKGCVGVYLHRTQVPIGNKRQGALNEMRLHFKTFIAAAAAIAMSAGSIKADVIHMRGGSTQAGVITVDRADLPTISIRTSGGEIAIPRTKIERVAYESKAQGFVHIGNQFLDAKNYLQAVTAFETALQYDKNNADIQARLREAQGGIAVLSEADKQNASAAAVEQIAKARLLLKEKKFEDALQLVRAADPGEETDASLDIKSAYADVYLQWGMDRADRQDFSGAAEKLQMALKFAPNDDQVKQQLVKVWEGDPTKVKEIASFYKNSTAPEDQIKLADAYFRMKNYEAALPIYLKYVQDPKLSTQIMVDRVRQMYDMLHRTLAERGEYEKALETYRAFLEFSPQEDPTPLARYEYMLRRSKTDVNNPTARAELAKFAEERGLIETAKREYRNILAIAPTNPIASAGLKRYATADLQDANDFFTETQYLLALQKANQVVTDYSMFADIVTAAQQLQTRAQLEQQKVARTTAQQAEALALRGDDYYNQALAYISTYTSTEVDRSQRIFSPKIEATKYLERALFSWRTALSIDPTLGDPTRYDLHRKIADAYGKYVVLANPNPPRLPTRDGSRVRRGRDILINQ